MFGEWRVAESGQLRRHCVIRTAVDWTSGRRTSAAFITFCNAVHTFNGAESAGDPMWARLPLF